ncbi:hypothetical protein COOONC_07084 [Cooperia oncophora]
MPSVGEKTHAPPRIRSKSLLQLCNMAVSRRFYEEVAYAAVRFGRVPKREKAKMVEEMQRTSAQSQLDALAVQFENEADAIERIAAAFTLLCGTIESCIVPVPAGRCPLQFHSYLTAIKGVVDFANTIPGFLCLAQSDRIQLLKVGSFTTLFLVYFRYHKVLL